MAQLSWPEGKTRLLRDGLWVAVGQVGAIVGALAGVRLLTELLPPDVFGEVTLFVGLVALSYALAGGPILQAVLRFYPDCVRDGLVSTMRRAAVKQLWRSGFWIAGIGLAAWVAYSQAAAVNPWLGFFLLPLLALEVARSLDLALLNAARRQRPAALWTTTEAWGRPLFAGGIVLVVGASTPAVLSSFLLSTAIIYLFFSWSCQREGIAPDSSPGSAASSSLAGDLLRYALPLLPLGIISWLSNQADRYVIGTVLGLEQTGLYAAAYGIASRPVMALCGIVETTLRPVYFQAVSEGDAKQTRGLFALWLGLVSAVAIGLLGMFVWLSQPIANVLLGPQYRGGAYLIPLIGGGYALLAIAQVFAGAMYARHNTRGVMVTEASGAGARVVFGVLGAYFYGLIGIAVSVIVAFAIQLVAAMLLTVRQPVK